jgi:hypothetical protein
MGPWILRTACAQVRAWQEEGHADLVVAHEPLGAPVPAGRPRAAGGKTALERTGLLARALDLEITESHAMQNDEATIATLRELKQLGVRISSTTSGSAIPRLNYLKRLPIDTLKIDQSFVRDITTEPDDAPSPPRSSPSRNTLKLQWWRRASRPRSSSRSWPPATATACRGTCSAARCPPDECGDFLAQRPPPPNRGNTMGFAHRLHPRRPGAGPLDGRHHHAHLPDLDLRAAGHRRAQGLRVRATQNPTRRALEKNLAALEGGTDAYCFASGMAATNAVLSLVKQGQRVVVSDNVYGGTHRLFTKVLAQYGVEFAFLEASDPKAFAAAAGRFDLLWIETRRTR